MNRGHFVLNDGTGVRWAARWQGVRLDRDHVGTDLVPRLCADGRTRGLRVFLLGGRPGVAERAADRLTTSHPGVVIAGCHDGYVGPGMTRDSASPSTRRIPTCCSWPWEIPCRNSR